ASGFFEQVQNGDHSEWQEAGTFVFDRRYQLSPDVSPQRFSVEGLRDAITDTMSLLGTPAGNLVRPLFERDPTGETQRIAEGLIPATSPRTEEGVWASRTAPRAMLLATTKASGSDLDAQAEAIARIETEYAKATQGMGADAPQLQLSGA
ncbi:transporter, partial [Bacillus amyloliquefaciens]|nr:transporter [Bacillus amyloliquefaciens]